MDDIDETDGAESDTEGTVFRDRYDWSSTPPSTAVIEAIASALDRSHDALAPLHRSVDPDALNEIVTRPLRGPGPSVLVSFSYMGCDVFVRSTGQVSVKPQVRER
jgi:hypothetical protein